MRLMILLGLVVVWGRLCGEREGGIKGVCDV